MTRTDRDHLRILAICHYILGGLCFVFGAFPIIYVIIGIVMVTEGFPPPPQPANRQPAPPGPPMEVMGWFFIGFGSVAIALSWCLAGALVAAGRRLSQYRSRTFCMVVAGFSCLFQPLGLVLGVFTFIVLVRPSVREAFEPLRAEPYEHDTYHSE